MTEWSSKETNTYRDTIETSDISLPLLTSRPRSVLIGILTEAKVNARPEPGNHFDNNMANPPRRD